MIWSIVLSKKTSLCAVGSNRCLEWEAGEDPLPAICWLMLLAGEQQHLQLVLGEIWIWSGPQPLLCHGPAFVNSPEILSKVSREEIAGCWQCSILTCSSPFLVTNPLPISAQEGTRSGGRMWEQLSHCCWQVPRDNFGLCPHRATSVCGPAPEGSPSPSLCFKQESSTQPGCVVHRHAVSWGTGLRAGSLQAVGASDAAALGHGAQGWPWWGRLGQGDGGATARLFLGGEWDQHNHSVCDGSGHPGRAFLPWCWSMGTSREPILMPRDPWQVPALCHGQPSAHHLSLCSLLIRPSPAQALLVCLQTRCLIRNWDHFRHRSVLINSCLGLS